MCPFSQRPNLSLVNSLPKTSLYIAQREWGRGEHKRYWGIKIKRKRAHLKMYRIIDMLDKYISNAHIGYRSWKYWHAATNHAKAMGYDQFSHKKMMIVTIGSKTNDYINIFFYCFIFQISSGTGRHGGRWELPELRFEWAMPELWTWKTNLVPKMGTEIISVPIF
jgi:hypothetical protein